MKIAKSKQKWYVADFETTSKRYYEEHGYTKVWLWAVSDSNANIVKYGDSIETFIDWCKENNGTLVFFHNLKFDGSFILNYLLENNFKYIDNIKTTDSKGFSALLGDMGEFYQIKINFSSHSHITIQDSLKIIPLKVKVIAKAFNLPIQKEIIDYDKYEINETTLSYIYNDVKIVAMALKFFRDKGFIKMTIGSNAYNDFKESCKLPSSRYPRLDREWLKEWRGAYRGGRSQVNPRYADKILHNVNRYDINSMYPYTMVHYPMPYGHPIEMNEVGLWKFELYEVYIDFTLKEGHLPTLLKTATLYNRTGDTYYTDSDGIIELKISNIDLELLKRHYDIRYLKYKKIYGFKTTTDMFKDWVMKYYNLKAVSTGGMRLMYKLIINNLYGKFGSKPTGQNKIPVMTADGLGFKYSEISDRGQYYLPVAIAVTSYAHKMIDDAIMLTGYDNFVYCDTDSVHTLGTLPDNIVDNKEIGKFKLESTETISKYVRQKCYIYKEDNKWQVTCSGMTESLKEYMVREYGDDIINQFKVGLHLDENSPHITRNDMKLRPKQVKGGVILEEVPFSLN